MHLVRYEQTAIPPGLSGLCAVAGGHDGGARQPTASFYRLRDYLRDSADKDGRGHVTNRALGHLLECSIANFPQLWKRLESKNILIRERSDVMGTTYRLLAPGETAPARPVDQPRHTLTTPVTRPAIRRNALDIVSQLERLEQLYLRGVLNDTQFEAAKDRVIEQRQTSIS